MEIRCIEGRVAARRRGGNCRTAAASAHAAIPVAAAVRSRAPKPEQGEMIRFVHLLDRTGNLALPCSAGSDPMPPALSRAWRVMDPPGEDAPLAHRCASIRSSFEDQPRPSEDRRQQAAHRQLGW